MSTPRDAEEWAEEGHPVILVRRETSPEDVRGMDAAQGILTSTGGPTSHAAVVARGWGKPCIVGATDVDINYAKNEFTANGIRVRLGDWISIDGTTGRVIAGQAPLVDPVLGEDFHELMRFADKYRTMRVRANADTPDDAGIARGFGAEGIGLCRTEHMFFEGDRIDLVRQMILGSLDYKRLEREIARIEDEARRTGSHEKRAELARQRREVKPKSRSPGARTWVARSTAQASAQGLRGHLPRAMDGFRSRFERSTPPSTSSYRIRRRNQSAGAQLKVRPSTSGHGSNAARS